MTVAIEIKENNTNTNLPWNHKIDNIPFRYRSTYTTISYKQESS